MRDRHENKNWQFRQAKPDSAMPGQFIRLYRSTKNPSIFKRVAKRIGSSSCNQWEAVTYTIKGRANNMGEQIWLRSIKELET